MIWMKAIPGEREKSNQGPRFHNFRDSLTDSYANQNRCVRSDTVMNFGDTTLLNLEMLSVKSHELITRSPDTFDPYTTERRSSNFVFLDRCIVVGSSSMGQPKHFLDFDRTNFSVHRFRNTSFFFARYSKPSCHPMRFLWIF